MKTKPQNQEYLTLVVNTDDGGLATFVPDLNLGFKIKPEFTTNFYDIAENIAFNQAINQLRFSDTPMEWDLYIDKINHPTPINHAYTEPVFISNDVFKDDIDIVITTLQLNANDMITEAEKSWEPRHSKYSDNITPFEKGFLTDAPKTPIRVLDILENFTKPDHDINLDILNQASNSGKKTPRPTAA